MVQTQHLNTTFFSLPQNTTTNPTRGQISHINLSCSKETTGCSVKTRNDLQTTTCIEKVDTTNGAEKQDLRLHGKANLPAGRKAFYYAHYRKDIMERHGSQRLTP
jgi:hypothetical protein